MAEAYKIYDDKKDCCGCGLCESKCPRGTITMTADEEGFLYPAADAALCVSCGLCAKVCPLRREGSFKETEEPRFYAARHDSEDVLMHSTSGGAFTAASDAVLAMGGIVYGAGFDSGLCVRHTAAANAAERDRMRISKYVQSDIRGVFMRIKEDLSRGPALFTGTPCQCAAVRGFFGGAEPEGLYVCDLLCHSVPSPLVWEAYKKLLSEERGAPVTAAQFRSKKYEWNRNNSNKGFIYRVAGSDEEFEDGRYYDLFIHKRVIGRPSCAACRFTDTRRASDITIADCWGVEKHAPELYDRRGVSLVIVNTPKGAKLFAEMSKNMQISERPKEEITAEQQRLSFPTPASPDREKFWHIFRAEGLEKAIEVFSATPLSD